MFSVIKGKIMFFHDILPLLQKSGHKYSWLKSYVSSFLGSVKLSKTLAQASVSQRVFLTKKSTKFELRPGQNS